MRERYVAGFRTPTPNNHTPTRSPTQTPIDEGSGHTLERVDRPETHMRTPMFPSLPKQRRAHTHPPTPTHTSIDEGSHLNSSKVASSIFSPFLDRREARAPALQFLSAAVSRITDSGTPRAAVGRVRWGWRVCVECGMYCGVYGAGVGGDVWAILCTSRCWGCLIAIDLQKEQTFLPSLAPKPSFHSCYRKRTQLPIAAPLRPKTIFF